MPQSRSTGPHLGAIVIYTETAATPSRYPAIISDINSDGTVRLTAFPVGGTPTDLNTKRQDETRTKDGAWSYPSDTSGI